MSLKGEAVRHFINTLKERFDPLYLSVHYQMIIPNWIDIKDSSMGKGFIWKILVPSFLSTSFSLRLTKGYMQLTDSA